MEPRSLAKFRRRPSTKNFDHSKTEATGSGWNLVIDRQFSTSVPLVHIEQLYYLAHTSQSFRPTCAPTTIVPPKCVQQHHLHTTARGLPLINPRPQ